MRIARPFLVAALAASLAGRAGAQSAIGPGDRYRAVADTLTRFIEAQLAQHAIPGLGIALVEDQRIVWARGFGTMGPGDTTRVTAQSTFRVASVSKLFTDVAVMQLVERGQLALDSPVARYTDGLPANPFSTPVTVRHLLSHRSGIVREPPLGHYFDPTSPSLEATARSLGGTRLVYAPGTATKYSNAAIALAGYLVQARTGVPFAAQLERAVLAPLGMTSSSFAPDTALLRRRARGTMEAPDGRRFPAPTFALGLGPASELTTTMPDLARFLMMLFAGGAAPGGGRILQAATLDSMWGVRPDGSAGEGFGLGFSVGRLEGRLRVSHGGWHYGFGTALVALPRERLGAVVSVTMDAAETPANRIADAALRLLLAAREGRPLAAPALTAPIPAGQVTRFAGRWRGRRRDLELTERRGALWYRDLTPGGNAFPAPVRRLGDTLVADGLWLFGPRLVPLGDVLVFAGDTLRRQTAARPAPLPARWRSIVGEYGWDHDVLYVLERDGALWALIEWIALYPLVERGPDSLAFPDHGLYAGEEVLARRDARGRVTALSVAGVVFPRRAVGPEDGTAYRVAPQRPIAQLRREAPRQRPPRQPDSLRAPDLVDLTSLDSTIRLDIRYAGSDNFLGTPMYSVARAMLQRPAAEALTRAHRRLAAAGYGLLIHDAYRPWSVTWMFWQATPRPLRERGFVADPARGSRHNRGCAVDLTLYDLATGQPVAMPSVYDEFTDRASPWYPGGTALERWHRDLLRAAMETEGFEVEPSEWWHFDWREWRAYPVLDVPLR
jgi:CubicO group peptidase (beta-lactamase class C family)/D-alanyl-D-alanine dipeptidase